MVLNSGQFGQKFARLQLSHVVRAVPARVKMRHVSQRLRVKVVVVGRICRLGRTQPPILLDPLISLVVPISTHSNQSLDEADALRTWITPKL